MGKSIRKNFIYNLLLTLSGYLISLVVFPYVSRVLGLEMMGRVGFTENVIQYFSMFATLGISILGVREIAACGDDKLARSSAFSSLLFLLLLQTIIVVVVLFLTILFVPKFNEIKQLLFIGIFNLLFTSLLVDWFYQGIEDFAYITIRSLSVRFLYAVSVFIFIKGPDDVVLFYLLSSLSVVLNALINLTSTRKFVSISFKSINLKLYFKQFYSLGVYRLMVSMYTTFNVIFIGFVCGEDVVGLYYTSVKIYGICIGLLSAYTTVVLPRMSSFLSEGNTDDFRRTLNNSVDVILSFALPVACGGIVLAPQIIRILAGEGYEGAIVPMQIIMPVVIISGMAQIWVVQILMPMKKDKIILIGSSIGAVVGIIANFIFVKSLGAIGSAIVLLLSEICGNLFTLVYVNIKGIWLIPYVRILKTIGLSMPYLVICLISSHISSNALVVISCACGMSLLYFMILNKRLKRI